MSKEVVIIDYGMGNLHSVTKAIAAVGGNPIITADKEVIAKAEKIILPGVGAFGDCMANLHKSGLVPLIMELLESGKPFLGICLGMQVLFEGSDEAPGVPGLGYFKGQVNTKWIWDENGKKKPDYKTLENLSHSVSINDIVSVENLHFT